MALNERLISYAFNSGKKVKVKVWFYIALYPVRWTAQSALHFPPLADLFIPTPFSASLGSILAMQQLRNDYSLTLVIKIFMHGYSDAVSRPNISNRISHKKKP